MSSPLKTERPWAEERRFGALFPIGLVLLSCLTWFVLKWPTVSIVVWCIAGAVLLLRFVCPAALYPLRILGDWIAVVVTDVLLAIVFYLIVTPIGWLRMLFGRDPMDRRLEPERDSYWRPKTDEPDDPGRWNHQF